MFKGGNEGGATISETGNWNAAKDFSESKIMIPLKNCDIYEDIARYGHESFMGQLLESKVGIEDMKFQALERLVNELMRICENAEFAMKRTGTKDKLKKIWSTLHGIRENVLPKLYETFTNSLEGTSGIKIRSVPFKKTLETVTKLKAQLNYPLNQNHLIFVDREEFDVDEFKERMKKRIVERG
jgi:hypothetical protein